MNEPSLSSASATSRSPRPSRAWLPSALTLPPIMGSSPPSASTFATSEVVVVFPCAPAMATPYLRRISSASISARGMTGTILALAARTSGFAGETAEEITTTWAEPMFAASCPMKTVPPSARMRRTVSDSFMSDPVTW